MTVDTSDAPDAEPDIGSSEERPRPFARRLRIGMALYGDLTFDSRVRREARSLVQAGHDVVIVCLSDDDDDRADLPAEVDVVVRRPESGGVLPGAANPFVEGGRGRISAIRRRVQWLASYAGNLRSWGATVPEAAGPVDCWHLHDFSALAAVAPRLPGDATIVYDAHDLFLETGTALRLPWMGRQLVRRLERRLIRRTAAVITVNQAVAQVLTSRYQPPRLTVVRNCPDLVPPPSGRPTLLRDTLGIPDDACIVLHHGRLDPQRGVDDLMLAMLEPGLETVHLVLLGFGDAERYRAMAAEPRFAGRAHVLDAVAPAELLDWVASADLAAMPLHDSSMNLYLSTPNKLFESLAAGIPVVASDFPAIREVILDPSGPLGAVCRPGDPASIATAVRSILSLTPKARADLRRRCQAAYRSRWNWQVEATRLTDLYAELGARIIPPDAGPDQAE